MEDVVELERDGQGVALQEALRELRVPYQLVRVHRLVRIATPRVLTDVRRKTRSPRGGDVDCGAVSELPCVEIALRLEIVTGVHIVERSVQLHLQP